MSDRLWNYCYSHRMTLDRLVRSLCKFHQPDQVSHKANKNFHLNKRLTLLKRDGFAVLPQGDDKLYNIYS